MKYPFLTALILLLTVDIGYGQTVGDDFYYIKKCAPNGDLRVVKKAHVFFYQWKDHETTWTYEFDETKECIAVIIEPKTKNAWEEALNNFEKNWVRVTETGWMFHRTDHVILHAFLAQSGSDQGFVISEFKGLTDQNWHDAADSAQTSMNNR